MYHVFIWYIDTIIQSLFSQLTHQNTQILAKSTQIEQYSLWVCCFNHSFWSEVFYSLKRLPPVSWFWSSSLSLWVGTITESQKKNSEARTFYKILNFFAKSSTCRNSTKNTHNHETKNYCWLNNPTMYKNTAYNATN